MLVHSLRRKGSSATRDVLTVIRLRGLFTIFAVHSLIADAFIRHHTNVEGNEQEDNLSAYDDFHFQLLSKLANAPRLP